VSPPPLVPGEGTHSLAGEGVGESQFRRGDIHLWYSIYVCMYFVMDTHQCRHILAVLVSAQFPLVTRRLQEGGGLGSLCLFSQLEYVIY
jgi:hypothetical protein